MTYCFSDIQKLAKKFSVPEEDILYILLNISGVKYNQPIPRMRTSIKLINSDEWFYFGLANNPNSPFSLTDNKLYFNKKNIAITKHIENDDCASSYFRKNKTIMTINSNQRSLCRGCKFCPNNLELNSLDNNLDTEQKLHNHFTNIIYKQQKNDLSFLERITICTGCFKTEEEALSHIITVYSVVSKLNFKGCLHYIGSQIQSEHSLEKIKEAIPNFMYTLTIECFSQRDSLLRHSKAKLNLDDYQDIMKKCIKYNFTVNYIYILGIDSLSTFKQFSTIFKNISNYFPSINLFQPHEPSHYLIKNKEADNIEYYLDARIFIENLYKDTNMRPQSWECYRPLWYYTFAQHKNMSVRI